jgi:hypothetical protein
MAAGLRLPKLQQVHCPVCEQGGQDGCHNQADLLLLQLK